MGSAEQRADRVNDKSQPDGWLFESRTARDRLTGGAALIGCVSWLRVPCPVLSWLRWLWLRFLALASPG